MPGGAELGIILLVVALLVAGSAAYIATIVALVDVAKRPEHHFAAVGREHSTWLVLTITGAVVGLMGMVVGPYYLLRVRPTLPPR